MEYAASETRKIIMAGTYHGPSMHRWLQAVRRFCRANGSET